MDGVLTRRVIELEGTVAKQEKVITKLHDHIFDLRHDHKELVKIVEGLKNLPKTSDIETLKTLCALVAGESRDNLHNFKTRIEKKMKGTESNLEKLEKIINEHNSSIETLTKDGLRSGEKFASLEAHVAASESNRLEAETAALRTKITQMEANLSVAMKTLSQLEGEKRKKKPVLEAIKEDILRLKHTVNSDHTEAIRALQKWERSSHEMDLAAMEKSLSHALAQHAAQKGGPVYGDDIAKVKRHIRSVEKRLESIDADSKARDADLGAELAKFSDETAGTLQKIARHVDKSDGRLNHSLYLPSFPENGTNQSRHRSTQSSALLTMEDMQEEDIGNTRPHDLFAATDSFNGADRGGERAYPYIEDAAAFDEHVRSNFDMSKLLEEDGSGERMGGDADMNKSMTS